MTLALTASMRTFYLFTVSVVLGAWITAPTQALASPPAVPASARELPPIILGLGEQRLLRAPGLTKYSLGNDNVKAIPLESDSLLIKGLKAGAADIWVWKKDSPPEHRSIMINSLGSLDSSTSQKTKEFERALSRLDEVEVIYTGSETGLGVVLRGEIYSMSESARVSALVEGYPDEVSDETELSSVLLDQGYSLLSNWVKKSGKSDQIRVERQDSAVWVRGAITDALEKPLVEKKIRAIFPQAQLEIDSLPDNSPTIHFKVFLLELKRTHFSSLGLSWPPGQASAFQISTSGIREALQLDIAIKALEGKGNAKVLSNPELVVRAPGEAELFSGGEIPIKTSTAYTSQVTWKSYGLTLKLKVTHVAGEKVRLDIMTEVSHLDSTTSSDNIPGVQANRMKTQVDARFGTPLLLSGLLQEGVREEAKGLPFLRRIPVLGALFGSEDYLAERSELVAILLPSAAPPPAPMGRFSKLIPKGPVPAPRNWISPAQEQAMRASPDFPWNALQ